MEDVALGRRDVGVAGDLAALDEDLLVQGDADRLAGARLLRRLAGVPGLDRGDARRAIGRREHQLVADAKAAALAPRSEERRDGEGWVRTCRSRWSRYD